jgi:radical SAM protein with 4Fe4S-binding SPASM domain
VTGKSDQVGEYEIGPEENEVLHQQDGYFIDRLFKQLDAGERVRFNPWAAAVRSIHNKAERRMRCGVGRGCTTVGIDGKLYPCHRYVGMEKYVLGDVSTGVDQERFTDYLRGFFETKKKCERCWAINVCGGYCPWFVSHDDGAFRPPQDWWCAEVRGWYEQGVWMYDTLRERYPDYFHQLVGEDGSSQQPREPILR